ncbi:hypothetical protein HUS70_16255 [Pandoraea nosoerga]|uniref:hypothetical protein n=1 Tax=Pandoraea nosoerga TaxID=2508296 RepID=UPI001982007B|nr:hypothetical protein [Pandoraea nosoerga]MBN4746170.1 hypothetical protein [Pandoraea nosoerga]
MAADTAFVVLTGGSDFTVGFLTAFAVPTFAAVALARLVTSVTFAAVLPVVFDFAPAAALTCVVVVRFAELAWLAVFLADCATLPAFTSTPAFAERDAPPSHRTPPPRSSRALPSVLG